MERGIFSLAARVLDRVESPLLGVELTKMIRKLRDAMSSEFAKHLRGYGFSKAYRVAAQAVGWGYGEAAEWAGDPCFARYLAVIEFNTPSGWGSSLG